MNRNLVQRIEQRTIRAKAPAGVRGFCRLWQGGLNKGGYGCLSVNGTMKYVHRLIYQEKVGPIAGQIDHLCKRRHCVNVAHMEDVTLVENVMRGDGVPARNARKTHCPRGHPLTPENTYPDSPRRCKICHRAHQRRYYERRKT